MDDVIAMVVQYLRASRRLNGDKQRKAVERSVRLLSLALGWPTSAVSALDSRQQQVKRKERVIETVYSDPTTVNLGVEIGDVIELRPAGGPRSKVTVTRLQPLMAVDSLKQPVLVECDWVRA